MDKRKSILVWLLAWAGLLLAVLYSPIGSPDLYTRRHYYSANQGVDFNGIQIVNAPRFGSVAGNNNSISATSDQSDLMNNSSAIVSGVISETKQGGEALQNYSGINVRSGSSARVSGGEFVGVTMAASRSSKEGNGLSQSNGVVLMSTDLTSTGNVATRQAVDYSPGSGATDPGDNPLGDPIPVGDGWIFLIILGSVYGFWKFKKV